MDNRNLILEINAKNEIIRINRGRQSTLAALTADNKTITWRDAQTQGTFRKSVESFLAAEGITIETTLIEGQKADVLPSNAPEAPKMHKMQGELTPAYLEWLMKWKPIAFQNLMGVEVRPLAEGEKAPADPRELWVRKNVIRSHTAPNTEAQGGQYITTRFKAEDQIIARRQSHLTFTQKEIFRGDTAMEQAEPYVDSYSNLKKMEEKGLIEIVSVKNAAASAGSAY